MEWLCGKMRERGLHVVVIRGLFSWVEGGLEAHIIPLRAAYPGCEGTGIGCRGLGLITGFGVNSMSIQSVQGVSLNSNCSVPQKKMKWN